jgi:hypothetical protein
MRKSSKYLSVFPISMILLFLLSCSTGYNKYADQYYEEGRVFYEKMEYDSDLPPFLVPPFKLEFVQYFPLKTITKKDQSVKAL